MVETGTIRIEQFTLESGLVLDQVQLTYEWDKNEGAPVVLFCHDLSETALVNVQKDVESGSYIQKINQTMIQNANYSTITFRQLCIQSDTFTQPELTTQEFVQIERLALHQLHIQHVQAIIGVAKGGIRAMVWGILNPFFMKQIISIAPPFNQQNELKDVSFSCQQNLFQEHVQTNINRYIQIHAKCLFIAYTHDVIAPPEKVRQIAYLVEQASYCLVNTPHGHQGVVKEVTQWGPIVEQFMEVAKCRQSKQQSSVSVP